MTDSVRYYQYFLLCLIATLGAATAAASSTHLRALRTLTLSPASDVPLYLPNAQAVRAVSLGFERFLGDILWFDTVSYFGKHYRSDKNYRWLLERCETSTTLNPTADHIYEFCGTLLAWEAKRPEASSTLLKRAIEARPLAWRFRYLYGFNLWYFHNNREEAAKQLQLASELPDAPPFIASQAARLLSDTNEPEAAVEYLATVLSRTKSPEVRTTLEGKLQLAIVSRDLSRLRSAVTEFERRTGRKPNELQELVTSGLVAELPRDPFGGTYRYDVNTDHLSSSSGKTGLRFHGKTVEMSELANVGVKGQEP